MCYVLYGVGLSYIVLTIITMMTAFPHVALEFFECDVGFVDVVNLITLLLSNQCIYSSIFF